eukprot:3891150-Pleurochrysis_carterae.AAC.1
MKPSGLDVPSEGKRGAAGIGNGVDPGMCSAITDSAPSSSKISKSDISRVQVQGSTPAAVGVRRRMRLCNARSPVPAVGVVASTRRRSRRLKVGRE